MEAHYAQFIGFHLNHIMKNLSSLLARVKVEYCIIKNGFETMVTEQ